MISIILPTFNRDSMIAYSIECVLSQSFIDYELIIVNDCSSDNTEEIIKNYCHQDQRIKYIKNETNLGCATSREIGYKNSQGNILVFLDDDDWWPADKLMKQYNLLMRDDYDMIISDYQIKQNNDLIYKNMQVFADKFKNEILKRPGPFFQSIMIKKNVINKMQVFFDKKEVLYSNAPSFLIVQKMCIFTFLYEEPGMLEILETKKQPKNFFSKKYYDVIKKQNIF